MSALARAPQAQAARRPCSARPAGRTLTTSLPGDDAHRDPAAPRPPHDGSRARALRALRRDAGSAPRASSACPRARRPSTLEPPLRSGAPQRQHDPREGARGRRPGSRPWLPTTYRTSARRRGARGPRPPAATRDDRARVERAHSARRARRGPRAHRARVAVRDDGRERAVEVERQQHAGPGELREHARRSLRQELLHGLRIASGREPPRHPLAAPQLGGVDEHPPRPAVDVELRDQPHRAHPLALLVGRHPERRRHRVRRLP